MRITTTETVSVHLSTGEEQRLIYVECRDVYFSLRDKTLIFYIEKGYIEDFEDIIIGTTTQINHLLSRDIMKVTAMNVIEGDLLEVIELKLKEIVLEMISNNQEYLSGMSTYTFE